MVTKGPRRVRDGQPSLEPRGHPSHNPKSPPPAPPSLALLEMEKTHLLVEGLQKAHLLSQRLHVRLQISLAQVGTVYVLVDTHGKGWNTGSLSAPGPLHSIRGPEAMFWPTLLLSQKHPWDHLGIGSGEKSGPYRLFSDLSRIGNLSKAGSLKSSPKCRLLPLSQTGPWSMTMWWPQGHECTPQKVVLGTQVRHRPSS